MTRPEDLWRPPPTALALSSAQVHVWRVGLEPDTACVEQLHRSLSADESQRAARFYFEPDRRRFIVARGALRDILGRYLGIPPSELGFCYSSYGKPALARTPGEGRLRFNVSHSHELALVAVTHAREVGVDLEYLRPDIACEEIAEHFFSARERASLRALPAEVKHQAFFNCWTRKEAYIKAHGEGLSLPLDQFDVSLAPGEPVALLATRHDHRDAQRWSLQALMPGPGYAAAVVVEGQGWHLTCWQWRKAR
ncbi:MAG TPA: 4'-phosphopantetheinyl transferase superfamily protein [Candidatus Tectomicrobia bacterium]|nr:4'-phosphopantetheinyl transferase superfamily protein [Candidatus Tectomicrobia bacterium]